MKPSPTTLGELCTGNGGLLQTGPFGSQLHASDYVQHGVPVVMPQDLVDGRISSARVARISAEDADRLGRHKLRANDIVFSRRGDIGRFGLVAGDQEGWLCGTGCLLVRSNPAKANPKFLRYTLSAAEARSHLHLHAIGATMPNLNTGILASVPLAMPSLKDQDRVAGILGALDDKIDLNRQICITLEEIASAIFRSWFIDFDSAGAADAPAGWDQADLAELVELDPPRKIQAGQSAPYVDMAALSTRSPSISSALMRPFTSGSRFRNGDTLLARITPCLENGKAAFVDCLAEGETAWGSTEFIVMRPKPPVPPEFAYLLARHGPFREFAITNMTGTSGRQRVSTKALANFPIAKPPPPICEAFGRIAGPLFKVIRQRTAESTSLAKCRDVLLPQLLAGSLVTSSRKVDT